MLGLCCAVAAFSAAAKLRARRHVLAHAYRDVAGLAVGGRFPASRLAAGKLAPVMAQSHFSLEQTPFAQPLFSAAAGLIYGAWIDGAALFSLALYLAGFVAVLAVLSFVILLLTYATSYVVPGAHSYAG